MGFNDFQWMLVVVDFQHVASQIIHGVMTHNVFNGVSSLLKTCIQLLMMVEMLKGILICAVHTIDV